MTTTTERPQKTTRLLPPEISAKLRGGQRRGGRRALEAVFRFVAIFAATMSVVLLVVLLGSIFIRGFLHLTPSFLTGVPDPDATKAGILPAMAGTIFICAVCAVTAIPIGVGTAILLEEYRPRRRVARWMHDFVQLNITNLAGVPSIVYGLLGLTAFGAMFGLFGTTLNPNVEIGASYFHQYPTSMGTSVLLPVEGRDVAPAPASAAMNFVNEAGEPVRVQVVADLTGRLTDADIAFTAFARQLAVDAEKQMPEDVSSFVNDRWQAAGYTSPIGDIDTPFREAVALKGRAARKAVEEVLRPAHLEHLKSTFGLSVDAATLPLPITRGRDRWNYLRLPFGPSVLAGGLTLMLVVLPIIIISSQEAIRAVPRSLRQASLAMGASRWQTIWKVTLPTSVPGIMTGVILAMSRAIGEAAPILILAGIVYITFTPKNLMDQFTAMPLQVYNWASRPQAAFYDIAAAGIILLLGILLLFNGLAILIRQRAQKL